MKKNIFTLALFTAVILALFMRGFNLGSLISPYWEEVALGYDAYSISQTGADHHGNPWPVVAFESFGDWKPSGYFYFAALAIKAFGLSVSVVRLPSMLAGLAIVIGMYFLTTKSIAIFAPSVSDKQRKWTAVVAVALASVSSWLIMFSRAAWEVNVATAFLLWGVISYLFFIEKRRKLYLFPSVLLFAASVYTYHATRVIAPILLLSLLATSFLACSYTSYAKSKKLIKSLPVAEIITGVCFLILLLPIFSSLRSPELSQRFAETSIFSNLDIIIESNQAIQLAGTPGAKLFFHRYILFGREILSNAFSHASLDFLFIHGDVNKRHSTGYFGILYYLDGVFLLAGLYALVRRYKGLAVAVSVWLMVGILPASISLASPHALRILPVAPALLFVGAFGAVELFLLIKQHLSVQVLKVVVTGLVALYIIQVAAFWRYFTVVYPKESALEWQYGYEEVMSVAYAYSMEGREVAISNAYGRSSMYYFFYNSIKPQEVQSRNTVEMMDQSEFKTFNEVSFFDDLDSVSAPDVLFIAPKDERAFESRFTDQAVEYQQVYQGNSPTGDWLWRGYVKK